MSTAADDLAVAEHKRLFEAKMNNRFCTMKDDNERSQFLTKEKFDVILECLGRWPELTAAQRRGEWSQGHAWMKKYAVVSVGGDNVLVFNEKTDTTDGAPGLALDAAVRVSHQESAFEDLRSVHVAGGHSKSKAFCDSVKKKFGKSLPRWVCEFFTESCPTCTRRLPRKPSSAGHKPILTAGLGSRGQVDLIDFQSCPDGDFKFLLNYQDHGIKLYENIPLTSKRNTAIAFALLDIFTRIGAPAILQTDNGREFSGAAGKGVPLSEEVCKT